MKHLPPYLLAWIIISFFPPSLFASEEETVSVQDIILIVIPTFLFTSSANEPLELIDEAKDTLTKANKLSLNKYSELFIPPPDSIKYPYDGYPKNEFIYICQFFNRFIRRSGLHASGGGGGGDDNPYSYGSIQTDDNEDSDFKRLADAARKCTFHNASTWRNSFKWCQQGKIFFNLIHFAKAHPKYAKEIYELISQLNITQFTKFSFAFSLIASLTVDVGVVSFSDWDINIVRALASSVRMSLKTIVPLLFGKSDWWIEPLSLWTGITISSVMDNAFAHYENSSYAMPWGSVESVNYAGRVISTTWFNNFVLAFYGKTLIPDMTKYCSGHLGIFFIGDTLVMTTMIYLVLVAQFAGYPAFAMTAGPNPYGPAGEYPLPYCPPKLVWIPWHKACHQSSENFSEQPED